MFRFYNSLTKRIEDFVPHEGNKVKLYTCGPTVYSFPHIGNFRSYLMEDVLERTLRFLGYDVTRAMNITDVGHLSNDSDYGDDKMVMSAEREHKSVMDIAKYYTEVFKSDAKKLNILWPQIVVPATSCIDEYIKIISTLMDKGYAYLSNGNVYFDVSKLKEYYVLTGHNEDDNLVGVREGVEFDDGKRNQADFVLWFTKSKFADQELKWESPWGVGYPGWHIECTGISIKYLGEYLDIHCGGVDNKFPHHTNEIAQSESYLGHEWCKYWFHIEHLNGENGKMSKSEGGFTTVGNLIEKGYDPLAYRYYCLLSHYSKPLVFSFDRLDGAVVAYDKLKKTISKIERTGSIDESIYNNYLQKFKDALENNLNTSMAITVLFDVCKLDCSGATKLELISKFDEVLALNLIDVKTDDIPHEIKELAALRWQAKLNKDWVNADNIRNELLNKGYVILDNKEGYTIEKK